MNPNVSAKFQAEAWHTQYRQLRDSIARLRAERDAALAIVEAHERAIAALRAQLVERTPEQ